MVQTPKELTMATARATGNHRAKSGVRSQPRSEVRSEVMSELRSRPRSQAGRERRASNRASSRASSGQPRNGSANGSSREPSTSEPPTATIGIARQTRDQLVSTIQQSQQVSIEAAQTWAEALSALPLRKVPLIPGFLAFPMQGAEAMTRFFFDVAADLLQAQREYALQLVRIFASEEPV
jgi:hypothetical protein